MVLTPPVSEGQFYRSLLDKGVRLVFVDRRVEGVDVPSIVSKDELGMAALVRHLVGLGHRRLCHLAGPSSHLDRPPAARQLRAHQPARPGLPEQEIEILPAGYYIEDGYAAMSPPAAAGAAARGGGGGQRSGGGGGHPGAAGAGPARARGRRASPATATPTWAATSA